MARSEKRIYSAIPPSATSFGNRKYHGFHIQYLPDLQKRHSQQGLSVLLDAVADFQFEFFSGAFTELCNAAIKLMARNWGFDPWVISQNI